MFSHKCGDKVHLIYGDCQKQSPVLSSGHGQLDDSKNDALLLVLGLPWNYFREIPP